MIGKLTRPGMLKAVLTQIVFESVCVHRNPVYGIRRLSLTPGGPSSVIPSHFSTMLVCHVD